MAKEPKETVTRVFVKKLHDGGELVRHVTAAPSSEVEARFDGYVEKTSKTSSSKPAGSSPS
jgi:hypothetical protein